MTAPDTITCKPTPWFLIRAGVMFLMFSVFAVLFYIDGSSGYRKKNEGFYLHKAFQKANSDFSRMSTGGTLSSSEWKAYAEAQTVDFPEDRSVLPAGLELPMKWPAVLQDYEKMKSTQWNLLWREYTKERGLNASPPEEAYSAGKIHEQWIVGGICLGLAGIAGFFLVRTLGRKISADHEAVTTQQGQRVPYGDLKTLDLRKWDTKGLAFLHYDGGAGKGRIRLDGLTYGGFKKEQGEPAERLMERIRANFSGEIIEYAPVSEEGGDEAPPAST